LPDSGGKSPFYHCQILQKTVRETLLAKLGPDENPPALAEGSVLVDLVCVNMEDLAASENSLLLFKVKTFKPSTLVSLVRNPAMRSPVAETLAQFPDATIVNHGRYKADKRSATRSP
jgi:hypothetical protein